MTKQQLKALQARLERSVDDPAMRRTLFRQAVIASLKASEARHAAKRQKLERRIDNLDRRQQRYRFLFETIAELRPDIRDLNHLPMSQVVALVAPTHPDLAEQLRELCDGVG